MGRSHSALYRRVVDRRRTSASQIPLCLAWSFTVHKSHGQSFDRAHNNLGPKEGTLGHTLVTLSRLRSETGLTGWCLTMQSLWSDYANLENELGTKSSATSSIDSVSSPSPPPGTSRACLIAPKAPLKTLRTTEPPRIWIRPRHPLLRNLARPLALLLLDDAS